MNQLTFTAIGVFVLVFAVGCNPSASHKNGNRKKGVHAKKTTESNVFHVKFAKIVKDNLVDVAGNDVDVKRITSKKYLLIYYAASWNGQSVNFTSKLVNSYTKAHENYEVVFVSADRNENSMKKFMREEEMPWTAVRYRSSAHAKMGQFRKDGGLPCLVLLDSNDDLVVDRYAIDGKMSLGDKLRELLR